MKKLGIVLGCGLLLFGMTGCNPPANSSTDSSSSSNGSSSKSEESKAMNTDPRKGWVLVQKMDTGDINYNNIQASRTEIAKKCDGTTLMYSQTMYFNGTAISSAVIHDSPECQPNQ